MADEVTAQPEQQEQVEEVPIPQEIGELDSIVSDLNSLANSCEKALEATANLINQELIQSRLKSYSKSLSHLPSAIQKLHDLRRHAHKIINHAEGVRKDLIKRRKNTDALSSEETRVIVACASIKDTVMSAVQILEEVLTHIRISTKDLISLIVYHKPGFVPYARNALRIIRVDYVSEVTHGESHKLKKLKEDLEALYELDEHSKSLS